MWGPPSSIRSGWSTADSKRWSIWPELRLSLAGKASMDFLASRSRLHFYYGETTEEAFMCRNIRTLHNFAPPATDEEIRASSLQFVRKLSGFTKPSKANEEAFNRAVHEVTHAAQHLLHSLVTNAPPRDREIEAVKARARSAK